PPEASPPGPAGWETPPSPSPSAPASKSPNPVETQQLPAGEADAAGKPQQPGILPITEHNPPGPGPVVKELTPEEIQRWHREVEADYRDAIERKPPRPGPALPDAPPDTTSDP